MKPPIIIYLDGKFKKVSQSQLKRLTPGLLKGLGVFETVLYENNKVFFLPQHYRRFAFGCDRYILPAPVALRELKTILGQLARVNRLKSGRVRLAAWRSGAENHFCVMLLKREPFPAKVYEAGFSICGYPQIFDRSPELAQVKSLAYQFFLKAFEHALKRDFHEALLVNSHQQIVEGSRSNIFYVKGRKLFTPHLYCGCLAGVTRQAVLKAAKAAGIKAASVKASVVDLANADEAFVTNSLVGIMPLTSLNGRPIANGKMGPVTRKLRKSYEKFQKANFLFLV